MDPLFHERLYRSDDVMTRLRHLPVTVCGAGALGANLTETLLRQGFYRLTVIDRDRVEERNLSTQPYFRGDIGAQKAKILANSLYRALGVPVVGKAEELTPTNAAKLLDGSGLVVDTFDNSVARRTVTDTCAEKHLPCLHVGLADRYGEIVWNERYRVPSDAHDDLCDYPLARNLVTLTVSVAAEVIVRFAATGRQEDYAITWEDFVIRPHPATAG
ncbi:MAG: ThiF family adenylyltransferase [Capsulimonadales bacterium]|nr:ThiF family adenylyltransferase [Capsulimonadales bacterium]